MFTLILGIFIIISFSKPEIMVNKKVREKASEEEIKKLASNCRKVYFPLILLLEGAGCLVQSYVLLGAVLFVAGVIVCVVFKSFTCGKENKNMVTEIKARTEAPKTVEVASGDVVAEETISREESSEKAAE